MRTTCRGCASSALLEILNFGSMPLAGGFLAGKESISNEILYDLKVHICEECKLIQILAPVDPEILFQDYSFSSSTIKPLVDHFVAYAQWLNEKYHPRTVFEFGCNDGVLLEQLQKIGVKAIGIDVSKNITDMARTKGLNVLTGYFNTETASAMYEKVGRADIVTGSNTFAHNDHPEIILEAAKHVLSENGILCIECMYAGDLMETLQWDTLYHEHLTFYSLTSLQTLLNRYGFHVIDAERIPMHGGSIRVSASQNRNLSRHENVDIILKYEQEKGLTSIESWKSFANTSLRKIEIVKNIYGALSSKHSIWAYGAAGKATMWVNACSMNYLGGVVDASPLRAGKLMPGIHTPILSPEEFKKNSPDYTFVTAWNYVNHIKSKEDWYKGVWSVPLPELKFF